MFCALRHRKEWILVMEWLEVTVYTTNEGIEPVSGRLYQVGIGGVSIEDETEFLDFLENNASIVTAKAKCI